MNISEVKPFISSRTGTIAQRVLNHEGKLVSKTVIPGLHVQAKAAIKNDFKKIPISYVTTFDMHEKPLANIAYKTYVNNLSPNVEVSYKAPFYQTWKTDPLIFD